MQLYDETKRLLAAKLGVDPDNLPLTLNSSARREGRVRP
jgi:hypothetical protein